MTNLWMFPTNPGVLLSQTATIDLTVPFFGLIVVLTALGLMLVRDVATSWAKTRTLRGGSAPATFPSLARRGMDHGTVRH